MKLGVLLMNTGTASEPTQQAISDYLRQFMMDTAIIGAPLPIRKIIAAYVSATRPKRTVANYQACWTPQGSPFMVASFAQRDALKASLDASLEGEVSVALAMRYGNPSIQNGIGLLRDASCDTVALLPSYPQQTESCAGTCMQEARAHLKRARECGWNPNVIEVPFFYDQPAYQQALADSVAALWTYRPGSKLVISFHSTPMKDVKAGDPYRTQTRDTAMALAYKLGIPEKDMVLAYQSRFDSRKWLGPFTEQTILKLAEEGVKDVCIICPGFTAENMETIIEVSRNIRAAFEAAAGKDARFTYVPALNDAPGLIEAMGAAVRRALEA